MADIEEHIRRAIEEGKFSNLAGKGKPLKLADDTHENPDWRLAHHILRESGFSLPWIELRRQIDEEVESLLTALHQAWKWRQAALGAGDAAGGDRQHMVEQEWRRAVNRFREQAEMLNKRIFDFNLQTPCTRFQHMRLDVESELQKLYSGGSNKL